MSTRIVTKYALSISVFLAVLIAWGVVVTNEDLFVALNGGRDVITGALDMPDTWSFATNGNVWVNQSWLSGFFLYKAYGALGEWGPFLLKGMLLAGIAILLVVRCSWLGASSISAPTFRCVAVCACRFHTIGVDELPWIVRPRIRLSGGKVRRIVREHPLGQDQRINRRLGPSGL